MKKILFIGSFINDNLHEVVWQNSKGLLVFSGDKFQHSLLDGILEYEGFIDEIITFPAIGSFPFRYKQLFFKGGMFYKKKTLVYSGSFLNITYFKKYFIYYSLTKLINKWVVLNEEDQKVIFVYSLIDSYISAAVNVKRKNKNVKICCIVLDLPEYFDENNSKIKKYLSRKSSEKISKLIYEIDSFILLTNEMKMALNINKKPSLLIEGIYLPKEIVKLEKQTKTILYSGKLDARFGIEDLLNAFRLIEDLDVKLWICGDGTMKEIVESEAALDRRIKYFGVVKPDVVLSMQQQANILINPRKGDEDYTKYSFPSKTMEYLASGTPTLMYKLDGVPDEYYEFIITIIGSTIDSLRDTIIYWISKPQSELDLIGDKAKNFILKNKTSTIQGEKIFNFLNRL